jgi:hypothetical protein
MKKLISLILMVGLLAGCSTFIPKKVEIGQDKVQKFPESKSREREVQRQAADRVARDALEVLRRITHGPAASRELLEKASDTAVVADSVSDSLGPPMDRNVGDAQELADNMNRATAKLNERVEDFKEENDENAGKKIEGTGKIKVPYFLWVGGFAVTAFVLFAIMKVVLSVLSAMNPGVALGTRAVSLGGRAMSKAFSQVLRGGQQFKKDLGGVLNDANLEARVLEIFKQAQNHAQDEETRKTVKHLIKE